MVCSTSTNKIWLFLFLGCLEDSTVKFIHANSSLTADSIAYDNNFSGFASSEVEGVRIAKLLEPDKRVLMMGNHGVLVSALDVPTAFFDLYYLERCCQFQVRLY